LERSAHRDPLVHRVRLALQAQPELLDLREPLALKVRRDRRVTLVQLALLERLGHRGRLVHRVHKGRKEILGLRELRAQLVPLDHRVFRAFRARLELPALLAQLVWAS
jgi:hypothetical protein